jgi:hypothetical protein
MGTSSSDHPKLFISPPFLQRDSGPLHFQNGESAEGDGDGEKVDQEREIQVLHDKLTGKERESGKEAVDQKKDGSEGIDADVKVGNTLQEFETGAGQKSIVAREKNLDGSCSPPKHLVKTIGKVDWSSSPKSIALGNTVN